MEAAWRARQERAALRTTALDSQEERLVELGSRVAKDFDIVLKVAKNSGHLQGM